MNNSYLNGSTGRDQEDQSLLPISHNSTNNNCNSNSNCSTTTTQPIASDQRKKSKKLLNDLKTANRDSLPMPRLVSKEGDCMIRPVNLNDFHFNNFRNWFHILIELSWRNIIAIFAAGFLTSWLFFGLLYYLIVFLSSQQLFSSAEDLQNQNLSEENQCIVNVQSFVSAFLFSLETQHTIGYGSRYMTELCPAAFFVLSVQCVAGVLLQTVLAGLVIAKEMRFSKLAVIGPIDEVDHRPALMIRLADVQHRLYLAESHVRLYMATTRTNKLGNAEMIGVRDMNVGYDTGTDRVLLLWPVVIRHIIDEDSPLYEITETMLRSCQFELLMTIEGIVEATGMTFQARTSFLPSEIIWGHRFTPLITLNTKINEYEVDYSLFDSTEPHPMICLPNDEFEKESEYENPPVSYNKFNHFTSEINQTFDQISQNKNSKIISAKEDQDRSEKNDFLLKIVTKNSNNNYQRPFRNTSVNYTQPIIIHTPNHSGFT